MAIIPITSERHLLVCNYTMHIHESKDDRLELCIEPEPYISVGEI